MQKYKKALISISTAILIAVLAVVFFFVVKARGLTFTVTNTNDSGVGSLRQAVLDANASPGADTINFAIPGSGPHILNPGLSAGSFPYITDTVTLDGTTQSGTSCSATSRQLAIQINMSSVAPNNRLHFDTGADNSVIKGLSIGHDVADEYSVFMFSGAENIAISCNNFGIDLDHVSPIVGKGIHISPGADNTVIGGDSEDEGNAFGTYSAVLVQANGTVVKNNTFGFLADGTTFLGGNQTGIRLAASPDDVVIESNIIGGTILSGITAFSGHGGINNLQIKKNILGTDKTQTQSRSISGESAIYVGNASSPNYDWVIGGVDPADRNVIVSSLYGIYINYELKNGLIQNNLIGSTDNDVCMGGITYNGIQLNEVENIGVYANTICGVGDTGIGIATQASDSRVGDTGKGNNIQNAVFGIYLQNQDLTTPVVANQITDTSNDGIYVVGGNGFEPAIHGNQIFGAGRHGIWCDGSAKCAVSGNRVSAATQHGIYIPNGVDSQIHNNEIETVGWSGVYVNATAADIYENTISNIAQSGIFIQSGSVHDNFILGVGGSGITANGNSSVTIYKNTLLNNGALGVDVGGDGISPNDAGDDTDPLNFPVVRGSANSGANSIVVYDVDLKAGSYRFDLCYNPSGQDDSGNGECEEWIATEDRDNITAGTHRYTMTIPGNTFDPANMSMQATLKDNSVDGYASSSELGDYEPLGADLRVDLQSIPIALENGVAFTSGQEPYIDICNFGFDPVTSFTLQNTFTRFTVQSITINTNTSSVTGNIGSYNQTTGAWNGLLYNGDCINFTIVGVAVGDEGQVAQIESEITSSTLNFDTLNADPVGGNNLDTGTITIKKYADLGIRTRLVTPAPITDGEEVLFEVEITNYGPGRVDLGNTTTVLQGVIPEQATYVSYSDLDPDDGLGVSLCQLQGNTQDVGLPFSAEMPACLLSSDSGYMEPGESYVIRWTLTATADFESGSSFFGAVLIEFNGNGNDPDYAEFYEAANTGGFNDIIQLTINNVAFFTYDTTPLSTTINRCEGQPNPTTSNDACFRIVFNRAIWPASFTEDDITVSGGGNIYQFTQISNTEWEMRVTGLPLNGTATIAIDAGRVADVFAGENNGQVLGENTIQYVPTLEPNQTPGSITPAAQSKSELARTGILAGISAPIGLALMLGAIYTYFDYRKHKAPLLAMAEGVEYTYWHHLNVVTIPTIRYRIKTELDPSKIKKSDKISRF